MRRNLLLSILIALCIPLLGNPVDENTAKQLAQNFWKENNIMGVKGDKVFKKKMDDARFVNVALQCGYTEFYIFNNEDGKGFVIIAADDCVTPILGYSYENNFAAENLPPNLKNWLDGYAEQIRIAVEMRATATEEIRTEWACLRQGKNLPIRSEKSVYPLITTEWGQSYPYNYYCPYNNLIFENTPTGCVATAMAQIMKYWEYPIHGTGSHSYNDWFYGQISANFGNTTYQWSSMPNSINSNSSQTQINAIATLMFHCGVSVEMNYGYNGSGASIIYDGYNTFCSENALKDYFGYSSSLQGRKKNDYSESGWIYQLQTELDSYRPILYAGQNPNENSGHAFICDGYDYYDRFSFNWGWNGTANNGWFYINNLNPNNSNYSSYQIAVIGIQPKSYNISATPSPNEGGSISGQGVYYRYEDCTLHATPKVGYSFVNWTENGSNVSSNPYYSFTVTRSRSLVANFQRSNYTITTTANPANGGTVTGGGNTFSYGQSCTVKATAKTDYVFVNWTENGTQVSTNANYTFTVSSNRELVANFQRKNYTISVSANPTTGGNVSGGGSYFQNQACTVSAIANEGYSFKNWTENGTQVSTNANYFFSVTGNRNLVANFQAQAQQYTIKVSANPSNGGSVSGGGNYNQGSSCTVHATPNSGFTFAKWTLNGHQVSDNANFTFTVSSNQNLVANFVQGAHTINATAGANGSINPSGNVIIADGREQTFTIIPDQDYEIKEVYIDGSAIGSTSTYTFTNVTEDHRIYAIFNKVIGVEEEATNEIEIYPNPTSGIVNIHCQEAELFNIYNTYGQLLISQNANGNDQVTIDISNLPRGIYLIQLISKEGFATKQIIKIP